MHALFNAGVGAHGDAEKLHAVAEFGRRIEIGERDRRNAFHINRRLIDFGAEGKARENRQLLRSVVALDVEGRIGLGIAEPLRLAQAILERDALLLHAREDVIAGAVEDAVDAGERIAVEPFAQRLHDRDAAGDRRLEIERHTLALGERRKLVAMRRQQRLVGCHHRFAGGERGLDRTLGRVPCSADHFHQDVDAGIAGKLHRIGGPAHLFQIDRALLAARTRAHGDDLDRAPAARDELVALALQKLDHGRADSA